MASQEYTASEIANLNALLCVRKLPSYSALDYDDVRQEAEIAALRAIRTWNPKKARFNTWVTGCVRNHLGMLVRYEYCKCRQHKRVILTDLEKEANTDKGGVYFSLEELPTKEPSTLLLELAHDLDNELESRAAYLFTLGLSDRAVCLSLGIKLCRLKQIKAKLRRLLS